MLVSSSVTLFIVKRATVIAFLIRTSIMLLLSYRPACDDLLQERVII